MTAAQTTVANGPTRPPVATASSWVSMASDRGTRNRLTPWARRTCRPRFGCRLCKSRLPATWDLVYDPSIGPDAATEVYNPVAPPFSPPYMTIWTPSRGLHMHYSVAERLLWSHTTCFSRHCLTVRGAHFTGQASKLPLCAISNLCIISYGGLLIMMSVQLYNGEPY